LHGERRVSDAPFFSASYTAFDRVTDRKIETLRFHMLLKRLYDDKLAQASFLIACQETDEAVVVDPLRDPQRYLDAAAEESVTITHVAETHIHADFVSGARDLARATGATLHLSAMGGSGWQYSLTSDTNVDLLSDGSSFAVGSVRIDVMHTPGHTPEHLTFLITDTTSADAALGAFTGDFIFVGDVGRPDLLERAAGVVGTKEAAARDLFRSLQRFKSLPDYLQLWPGHGPGSACGRALGAMPQSTLGYERLFNWGLAETNEDAFVRQVLTGQPDPPAYFAVMKRINRDGPPARTSPGPARITAHDLAAKLREGTNVVDTRPAAEFASRHAAGSINIPYSKSFLNWAGSLLPYDRDIYLITAGGNAAEVVDNLALIGVDRIGGTYSLDSFDDLVAAGVETRSTPQVVSRMLREYASRNGKVVLDVRTVDEWDHGHIPGAIHIPLGSLQSRLDEIPTEKDIAVHCQGGNRSVIATSILEKNGITASNIAGGFAEWERSGGEVERSG
jgi:hydroxyacylglutathione hydrolase